MHTSWSSEICGGAARPDSERVSGVDRHGYPRVTGQLNRLGAADERTILPIRR